MKKLNTFSEFVGEAKKDITQLARELVEITAGYVDVDLTPEMNRAMSIEEEDELVDFLDELETEVADLSGTEAKKFKKEAVAFLKKYGVKVNESAMNEGGYVEALNPDDLQEAVDKIASVWTDWKKGPATKSSDINPARKELLAYIEKQLK